MCIALFRLSVIVNLSPSLNIVDYLTHTIRVECGDLSVFHLSYRFVSFGMQVMWEDVSMQPLDAVTDLRWAQTVLNNNGTNNGMASDMVSRCVHVH